MTVIFYPFLQLFTRRGWQNEIHYEKNRILSELMQAHGVPLSKILWCRHRYVRHPVWSVWRLSGLLIKEHQHPDKEYYLWCGIAHSGYMCKFMGYRAFELFPVEEPDQPWSQKYRMFFEPDVKIKDWLSSMTVTGGVSIPAFGSTSSRGRLSQDPKNKCCKNHPPSVQEYL